MEPLPRTSKLRCLVPLLLCLAVSVALGFLVNDALLRLHEPASRRDEGAGRAAVVAAWKISVRNVSDVIANDHDGTSTAIQRP
jgi:hypothetical protein